MHITHVNLARGFRGGERQTVNLMEGLRRLGCRQVLVCRRGGELEKRARQLDLPVFPIRHPLTGHTDVFPTDLVHVHEARGAQWAGIEYLLRGTRYVITRRIPTPLSRSSLTAAVYRHAAALFGVSRDVSNRLAAQTGRDVSTVLSCASHYRFDAREVAIIRKRLGKGPVIGHVGVLHDNHKGQSILISAFRRLTEWHPDARLLLVGSGPDRAAFEQLAGGDERIVFAGQRIDPGPWLAAMDVFAFPSREEGLGSSVLDAMLAGVPVIASAAGGLPELIGAGQRGLLVDRADPDAWADAIDRMLSDEEMRLRVTATAKRFAQQNDVMAMAESYASSYRRLLGEEPSKFGLLGAETTSLP